MIRHIRHQEIDKDKWDTCVSHSGIDLEYAHAWYLDVVCPGWDALVMNDYEVAMPVTINWKLGISYMYQPYFTQQLGVFSTKGYATEIVNSFLDAIFITYRLIEIQLNELNHPSHNHFRYLKKKNYTLHLMQNYDSLYNNFSRNCRRNIKKAENAGLIVKEGLRPEPFVRFFRKYLSDQLINEGNKTYQLLQRIIDTSLNRECGEVLSIYAPDQKIVGAAWFLKGKSRLFFQACVSSPEGKKNEAMYLLVNHVIKQHASSDLILDFTGSILPGVEYFNTSFGALRSTYPAVYANRLPKILRTFKKS